MEEILGKKEKIFIILSIIVCLILRRPEGYLLLLGYFVIFLGIFLLSLKDKMKKNQEYHNNVLAEKRTTPLICTITEVQNELDVDEYIESVRIYCEYAEPHGKIYKFKSRKVLGITECKAGDFITVLVDPQDYNNYYVQTQSVVHM